MAKKAQAVSADEQLKAALVSEAEQPYVVPANWVWAKLGAVLLPMTTRRPTGDYFEYIDIDSIDNERLIVSQPKRLEVSAAPSRASRGLEKDNTVFSLVRPYLRNIAFIDESLAHCIASTGFYICKPSPALDGKYLFYLMQSDYIVNGLTAFMKGDNSPSVRKDELENYSSPLPPLPEQHRIVARIESLFEKLDRARELAQNALETFETRKAAILHKAFTGELTAKWREENGVGMESWTEKLFSAIIQNGPQNGLYKPQSFYGRGFRIVRIDNFYDGVIHSWNDIKKLELTNLELESYGLKINDILINRVNSMPYLGKSALVRNLDGECVFESNIMRLDIKQQLAMPEYVIRYLNSTQGLVELKKNAKQAVNQASINQQDVKNVSIPLPLLAEQQEIVRILDDLLEKEQQARELTDVIEQIDLMKKAILARAFRGELGTNDPSEESAMGLLREVIGA